MPVEPELIPRRTAYRLCGKIMMSNASELFGRAKHTPHGRGEEAAQNAAAKQPGRDVAAEEMKASAKEMFREADHAYGDITGGVDAAVFGYLMAWLAGVGDFQKQIIAEMEELGLGERIKGVRWSNRTTVCRAVIGVSPKEKSNGQ